jgi:hypothetical protein
MIICSVYHPIHYTIPLEHLLNEKERKEEASTGAYLGNKHASEAEVEVFLKRMSAFTQRKWKNRERTKQLDQQAYTFKPKKYAGHLYDGGDYTEKFANRMEKDILRRKQKKDKAAMSFGPHCTFKPDLSNNRYQLSDYLTEYSVFERMQKDLALRARHEARREDNLQRQMQEIEAKRDFALSKKQMDLRMRLDKQHPGFLARYMNDLRLREAHKDMAYLQKSKNAPVYTFQPTMHSQTHKGKPGQSKRTEEDDEEDRWERREREINFQTRMVKFQKNKERKIKRLRGELYGAQTARRARGQTTKRPRRPRSARK